MATSPFNIDYKLINKAEIARRIGYTLPYVQMLLTGKRKNPAAIKKVLDAIKEHYKNVA